MLEVSLKLNSTSQNWFVFYA